MDLFATTRHGKTVCAQLAQYHGGAWRFDRSTHTWFSDQGLYANWVSDLFADEDHPPAKMQVYGDQGRGWVANHQVLGRQLLPPIF